LARQGRIASPQPTQRRAQPREVAQEGELAQEETKKSDKNWLAKEPESII